MARRPSPRRRSLLRTLREIDHVRRHGPGRGRYNWVWPCGNIHCFLCWLCHDCIVETVGEDWADHLHDTDPEALEVMQRAEERRAA